MCKNLIWGGDSGGCYRADDEYTASTDPVDDQTSDRCEKDSRGNCDREKRGHPNRAGRPDVHGQRDCRGTVADGDCSPRCAKCVQCSLAGTPCCGRSAGGCCTAD
jgi:hypothetical protein